MAEEEEEARWCWGWWCRCWGGKIGKTPPPPPATDELAAVVGAVEELAPVVPVVAGVGPEEDGAEGGRSGEESPDGEETEEGEVVCVWRTSWVRGGEEGCAAVEQMDSDDIVGFISLGVWLELRGRRGRG